MKREHLFGMEANSRGAVAPTVALSLFALVGAAGIAFDYSRMASLDTELQNAADQAALAAATQLDYEDETCERAVEAARNLLVNQTVMANDGAGLPVTIEESDVCGDDTTIVDDANATVRFFQDKALTDPAEDDSEANFVQVTVDARKAEYALTPIVGAFESGDLRASAAAGLSTALCKVPPLMVCPPNGVDFDWNTWRGRGVRAVSNSGQTWAPGAFGYIGPGDTRSTQIGLAYENPVFQCQEVTGTQNVDTGGPSPAIEAINTRFGIYDNSGGGTALAACSSGSCPSAENTTKDLVNTTSGQCGTRNGHNNGSDGWHLPVSGRFEPRAADASDTAMTRIHNTSVSAVPAAMGLPRDNMHYCTYNGDGKAAGCSRNYSRFGDGKWARGDYFNKYHPSRTPANASTMTRFETYRWELDNNFVPNAQTVAGSTDWQLGVRRASCGGGVAPDASRDRRVLQVAIAGNCAALRGTSVPVQITKWVEMFLVEPGTSGNNTRRNGDDANEIYLEVIREVDPGGNAPQLVRRDTPYLIR